MPARPSRRGLLRTATAAGAAAGLGQWAALLPVSPARAEDAAVTPDLIRFGPDIEPVVRLIERTPRDDCVAVMVGQLRQGLPYRRFLAALYLTAVRAADYHAGVHSFDHNAYSIHAVNRLTLDLPVAERLLPAFWALDALKASQQRFPDKRPTPPLRGPLPAAGGAADDLCAGIEGRDRERAERAVVALARSQGRQRVTELLFRYAGRDRYFIGHLAILVSNSCRLLETIGWRYAEPVLRYVVAGLSGMKEQDSELDRYAENRDLAAKFAGALPGDWAEGEADAGTGDAGTGDAGTGDAGTGDAGFTKDLLARIRERDAAAARDLALRRLAAGKAKAGAVWDAVLLGAAEIVMSAQKNGSPLHANTAANALRYAFGASGEPQTRLLLLLQALAWMTRFRESIAAWPQDHKDVTTLAEADVPSDPEEAAGEILATLSMGSGAARPDVAPHPVPGWHGGGRNVQPWRHDAAARALAFARRHRESDALTRAAARLVVAKADGDPHRVKFPVAMLENLGWVSPTWRPHMLAAATYSFLGADAPDSDVVARAREAVRKL